MAKGARELPPCECCGETEEQALSEGGVYECGCSDDMCDQCGFCTFCCDCDD